MPGKSRSLQFVIIIAFYSLLSTYAIAQEGKGEDLPAVFAAYSDPFRETAYCHLNKSTYIKGEMVGFSGYVFEKDTKIPSKSTKNLYCIISDENNKVIKSKLVKVSNGFTHNVFEIDSSFTSGNYRFKAYTNWMKNFDEPNAFVESFRVIDPEVENAIKKTTAAYALDAQFLPEGGHFVDAVKTNVGVIVKDPEGYGVPNIKGEVFDENNALISGFKTNHLGIGRFQLIPRLNQKYLVRLYHLDMSIEYFIDDIKPKGVTININSVRNDLAIELQTNDRTLNEIRGKPYKLTFHNGKQFKGLPVVFEELNLARRVKLEELLVGVNIITLFNENNEPVLERLFFNYEGLNLVSSGHPAHRRVGDSVRIEVPLPKFADPSSASSNISISVLPENTKAYNRHHTIVSDTYLRPYVRGYIENAGYYFTDLSPKKKYELDNLLITQGWSSYDWDHIFKNSVNDRFAFEEGIVLKANQNNKRQRNFMLYPLKSNAGVEVNLPEDENSFIVTELYPEEGERLGIATVNNRGKASKPNLYLQFFPSVVPDYYTEVETLNTRHTAQFKAVGESPFRTTDLGETQVLDEVVIKANAKELEIKKLESNAFYDVDIFDDAKRRMNMTFANYVNAYIPQFFAREGSGNFILSRRVSTSLRNSEQVPIVYLDDMLMTNLNIFYGFYMNVVDYVTVNENGLGEGFIGKNGVIRIYTSLDFIKENQSSSFKSFEFPLAFAKSKEFYVPKYEVYMDAFFEQFGVIDWIPDGKIDAFGNLNFTVYNPANTNMKLYIEGANGVGDLISVIKVLDLN
jgi:hypothetical protein